MKTFYTLVFLFASVCGFSQAIPNGGFENWNTVGFLNPNNFYLTSNYEAYNLGLPVNTTRVTDAQHLTYAVNMLTVSNSTDTLFGYVVNGDPGTLEGGIPMNEIPTSVTGYYKCAVPAGDTAIFLVIFKQGGNPIGQFLYRFYGNQSTYAPFSLPITLPGTPDTVILGAASSNAFQWQGIPGSMLQIDNISFTGVSNQPALLNGSFENWTITNAFFPALLDVSGDTALRTTDAYAGNYAIKLTTVDYGNNQVGQSGVTNGTFTNNGIQGGRSYSQMQDTICGYYKFLVNGVDSGAIWINLSNNGNPVGGNYIGLPPVSVYTYFEFPFSAGSPPDTLLFYAGSTYNNTTPANAGSVLYLDEIRLKTQPLSTPPAVNWKNAFSLRLYPNPATDITQLDWNLDVPGPVEITLADLTGKILQCFNVPAATGSMILDVASLPCGTYLISLKADTFSLSRKLLVPERD